VSLKRGSLDDRWQFGLRAIGLAVPGTVWSEGRKIQVALGWSLLVAGSAMVNERNSALVSRREYKEWLVLEECA
jgi:hypothetical protein